MVNDASNGQQVDLEDENGNSESASLGVALLYVARDHAFDVGEFALDIISLTSLATMAQKAINHGLPQLSGTLALEACKLGILGPAVFVGAIINSVLGIVAILMEMKEIYREIEGEWQKIKRKKQNQNNELVTFGEMFSLYCKGAALLLGGLGLIFGVSVIAVASLGMGGVALGAAAIPLAIFTPVILEVVLAGITFLCVLPKLQKWYQDYCYDHSKNSNEISATKNQMLASEREAAFGISLFAVHMIAVASVLLMCSMIAGSVLSGGWLPVVVCGTALFLAMTIKCFQTADSKRNYKYTNAMREKIVSGCESMKQAKNTVTEGCQRFSNAASTAWSSFSFFSQPRNHLASTVSANYSLQVS